MTIEPTISPLHELKEADGPNQTTYTYLTNDFDGDKLTLVCKSFGYGTKIPPSKSIDYSQTAIPPTTWNWDTCPATQDTWILCQAPNGKAAFSVWIEPTIIAPRIIVSQLKLRSSM